MVDEGEAEMVKILVGCLCFADDDSARHARFDRKKIEAREGKLRRSRRDVWTG